MIENAVLALSFFGIGGGLKYIDEVHDSGLPNKSVSFAMSILIGLTMSIAIELNYVSATLLLAIIFGVGIMGKIDNRDFKIVAFIAIALPFLFAWIAPFGYIFQIQWSMFVMLIILVALDEFVSDYIERNRVKAPEIRPILEVGLLALGILGWLSLWAFAYILAFDAAYMLVRSYSKRYIPSVTVTA